MLEHLAATSPLDDVWPADLPAPTAALHVSVVEALRRVVIRHLAGGTAAANDALTAHRLPPLPGPGTCLGHDPWLVWVSPTESLLLTTNDALADRVVAALSPGAHPLTCALEQSAGGLVFELHGVGVDALLPHLLDDGAMPRQAGQGVRTRFMEIRAVVIRAAPDRVLVAVDRSHGRAVAERIGLAWRAAQG